MGLFIYTHFHFLIIKNRIASNSSNKRFYHTMAENNASGNPLAGEPGATTQPQAGNQNQNQNPTTNTPQAGEKPEPKLTKEEFDRLSKDAHEANNEAKNLRARLRALESTQEQAEQERLKKQGEFETLYQQEQAKVKELAPVVDENKFLRDYAMKQLETTIENWPEEVKAFDPGKKATLQARLDWLEKSKPLVAKLQGQQQAQRQAGVFRSPLPASNQQGSKTADDYYKEMKAGRPF